MSSTLQVTNQPAWERTDARLLALLTQITQEARSLHHDEESHDIDGNRRSCRHTVAAPIYAVPLRDNARGGQDEPGWVTDLSLQGIGFLCQTPFASGTHCLVNLESLCTEGMILRARVVYCQQLLDHTYRIGAGFVFEQGSLTD